jgi:glycosyltransferase involved in cell wall biosynthesis
MKIAQVVAYWGPAYPSGSGVSCYEISRRLAQEFEVHVFTSSIGNFDQQQHTEGFYLHPLRTCGTIWNMNPVADVFTKLLRYDFDIIHVHSYIFFLSNMAALARVFKRKSRYILHFRGGLDYFGASKDFPRSRIWAKEHIYDRTLGYFTVRLADRVLSVSKSDIPTIQKKFGIKQVHWIANAVDTEKFTAQEQRPVPPVVTYVGKLESWKGIGTLIKSFEMIRRHVKDAKLLVVGTGSLESKLRELDLPIECTGHVSLDEMPSIYQRTSVFILPSYMEGFPVACIEALACEVPVIATDVGDASEIVIDGVTGALVQPGDFEEIAIRAIKLLKEGELAAKMGKEGRAYVKEKFSYEAVIKRLKEVYEEAIQSR